MQPFLYYLKNGVLSHWPRTITQKVRYLWGKFVLVNATVTGQYIVNTNAHHGIIRKQPGTFLQFPALYPVSDNSFCSEEGFSKSVSH